MPPLNRSKPLYIKLDRMAPRTHDHNIVVQILEKEILVDKEGPNGLRIREEQVLVGDETGCMYMRARNEQCDKFTLGNIVELCNAKVMMVKGTMRLAMDKWGSIKSTTIAIPGETQKDPNFSEIVYGRVAEST